MLNINSKIYFNYLIFDCMYTYIINLKMAVVDLINICQLLPIFK